MWASPSIDILVKEQVPFAQKSNTLGMGWVSSMYSIFVYEFSADGCDIWWKLTHKVYSLLELVCAFVRKQLMQTLGNENWYVDKSWHREYLSGVSDPKVRSAGMSSRVFILQSLENMWINEETHILLEPQEKHHCHLLCKTAAEYHSL